MNLMYFGGNLIFVYFTIMFFSYEGLTFEHLAQLIMSFVGIGLMLKATADNSDFKTASPKLKHS